MNQLDPGMGASLAWQMYATRSRPESALRVVPGNLGKEKCPRFGMKNEDRSKQFRSWKRAGRKLTDWRCHCIDPETNEISVVLNTAKVVDKINSRKVPSYVHLDGVAVVLSHHQLKFPLVGVYRKNGVSTAQLREDIEQTWYEKRAA